MARYLGMHLILEGTKVDVSLEESPGFTYMSNPIMSTRILLLLAAASSG